MNRFGDLPKLKRRVDRKYVTHSQGDSGLNDLLESSTFKRDSIGARLEGLDSINAFGVGHSSGFDIGVGLDDRDLDVAHSRSAGVGYRSGDGSSAHLGMNGHQ